MCHNLLWAPILDDPSKENLLRVIRNVRPESIYCLTPVTIRALDEFRSCHSCTEWLKYFCKAYMIELPRELKEFGLVAMLLLG